MEDSVNESYRQTLTSNDWFLSLDLSDEESKQTSDVYIDSRKLVIIFHNGWTAVNSTRFNNFVFLQGDPKTETFQYPGTQALDNVFVDEYGVIVFQLEFTGCST